MGISSTLAACHLNCFNSGRLLCSRLSLATALAVRRIVKQTRKLQSYQVGSNAEAASVGILSFHGGCCPLQQACSRTLAKV